MPRTITQNLRKASRSAGFTLIEILVTISIIAILAAISIPAMSALYRNAAEAQTKTLLKQLDSSVEEYRAQTQQDPISASGDYVYPSADGLASFDTPSTGEELSVQELVTDRFEQVQPALNMINTVNEAYVHTRDADQNVTSVKDAWDRPVRFFPGTRAIEAKGASHAGMLGDTEIEDKGLYRRKSPYFASAGPDGIWGQIDAATDTPNVDAEDNLYSFEAD